MPQEERALEAERQKTGDPPRPERQLVGVAELGVQPLHRVVEPVVQAARLGKLAQTPSLLTCVKAAGSCLG